MHKTAANLLRSLEWPVDMQVSATVHKMVCDTLSPPFSRDPFTRVHDHYYHCVYTKWDGAELNKWVQSSGVDWCEWGHLSQGLLSYDITGRHVIEHRQLKTPVQIANGRPDQTREYGLFLNGKEVRKASRYASMIFMPYDPELTFVNRGYKKVWNGEPPTLVWQRWRMHYDRLDEIVTTRSGKDNWEIHTFWLDDSDPHLFYIPALERETAQLRFKQFKTELPKLIEKARAQVNASST